MQTMPDSYCQRCRLCLCVRADSIRVSHIAPTQACSFRQLSSPSKVVDTGCACVESKILPARASLPLSLCVCVSLSLSLSLSLSPLSLSLSLSLSLRLLRKHRCPPSHAVQGILWVGFKVPQQIKMRHIPGAHPEYLCSGQHTVTGCLISSSISALQCQRAWLALHIWRLHALTSQHGQLCNPLILGVYTRRSNVACRSSAELPGGQHAQAAAEGQPHPARRVRQAVRTNFQDVRPIRRKRGGHLSRADEVRHHSKYEHAKQYGPIFKTYGPSGANVVVTSPELTRYTPS